MKYVVLAAGILLFLYTSCKQEIAPDILALSETSKSGGMLETRSDTVYNHYFTRFGSGWTGGDATYSVLLPDGRTLWMFGDTFMDTVFADRSRPLSAKLIRNSFVVQDGDSFTTLYQGTYENPESFIPSSIPDYWYWPLEGFTLDNKLFVFLSLFKPEGGGAFGFEFVQSDLAVFSLPDIQLQKIVPIQDRIEILFGASILVREDTLYVYGSEPYFITQYAHVFRLDLNDLTKAPEFWAGDSSWSANPVESERLIEGPFNTLDVSAQFKTFYHSGKYYLLSQIALSDEIYLYDSNSPVGPWKNKRLVYTTPESGGDIWTYNAYVHPHLTEWVGGSPALLMSYNVNSFNFLDLFNNADIYKPRFVRIRNWE